MHVYCRKQNIIEENQLDRSPFTVPLMVALSVLRDTELPDPFDNSSDF